MRNDPSVGPYRTTNPRNLWWPKVGGLFLMSEVPSCGTYTSGVDGLLDEGEASREGSK